MKQIGIILLLVLGSAAFAQEDFVVKKDIEILPFEKIYVNSAFEVFISQGKAPGVKVEMQQDILKKTEFFVEDGILFLNIKQEDSKGKQSVWGKLDAMKINPTAKIIVTVTDLTEIMVNGSGSVTATNSIATDNIKVSVNGNGSIELDLKGDAVEASLTGAGKIKLKGYGSHALLNNYGEGKLDALALDLTSAEASVYGSGELKTSISESVNAYIYGSGKLEYKGEKIDAKTRNYGEGELIRSY